MQQFGCFDHFLHLTVRPSLDPLIRNWPIGLRFLGGFKQWIGLYQIWPKIHGGGVMKFWGSFPPKCAWMKPCMVNFI